MSPFSISKLTPSSAKRLMTFSASAITSGPMPSPGSSNSLWVAMADSFHDKRNFAPVGDFPSERKPAEGGCSAEQGPLDANPVIQAWPEAGPGSAGRQEVPFGVHEPQTGLPGVLR